MVEDLRTQRDRAQAELEGERTRDQVAVDALALARIQTLDLAIRLGRLETLIVTGRRGAIEAERVRLASSSSGVPDAPADALRKKKKKKKKKRGR